MKLVQTPRKPGKVLSNNVSNRNPEPKITGSKKSGRQTSALTSNARVKTIPSLGANSWLLKAALKALKALLFDLLAVSMALGSCVRKAAKASIPYATVLSRTLSTPMRLASTLANSSGQMEEESLAVEAGIIQYVYLARSRVDAFDGAEEGDGPPGVCLMGFNINLLRSLNVRNEPWPFGVAWTD